MKDEILDENLDEIEEINEIGNEPIHARKSFNQLICSILVYAIFYIGEFSIFESVYRKELIGILIGLGVGLSVFFLNLYGMINASKSERFQEVTSWKKYVGAVGNMLMFFPSFILLLELLFTGVYYFLNSI